MRWFGIVALLWLGYASAQSEVWNPVSGVYLPPVGQKPLTQSCQIRLESALANHLSYDVGGWGEIAIDLEEVRFTPGLYQGTPWGEFAVQLPFRLYYGGFLDYALNPLHEILNLPLSPIPPQTLIYLRREGLTPRGISSPVAGFGDPVFSWGWTGPEKLWGRVSLALPLGDAEQFMGSGGFRIAATVGWSDEFWGLTGQLVVPLGQQPVFRDFGTRASLGARLWTRLPWDLPGRLELQATTSPMPVGGQFAATVLALRYVLDKFSFSEDGTAALPDVVFTWTERWECPWQ